MIGILLALALQSPSVNAPKCKGLNETTNVTFYTDETTDITPTFLKSQVYVVFAMIITVVFLIGNMLLVLFVKEIDGNFISF